MCTHGSVVRNPHTGQSVYVPCGVCDACMYVRSLQNSLYCSSQEKSSKYCYFITLTYSARYVPFYTITRVADSYEEQASDDGTKLDTDLYSIDISPRLPLYRSIKSYGTTLRFPVKGLCMNDEHQEFVRLTRQYYEDFSSQSDLSCGGKYPDMVGKYPYLCRGDVQLFMKRLRYYAKKKLGYYETIHSYIVGEYGPKTFRPHFHLLLFFESEELAANLLYFVRRSWRFGRVDCSASRGDATSYVANYTNGFSRVPYHIRNSRKLRPFARFSNGFARSVSEYFIQEGIQGNFAPFIDGLGVNYHGRLLNLRPRRSHLYSCFYYFAGDFRRSRFELSQVVNNVRNVLNRPAYRKLSLYAVPREMYKYYYSKPSEFHADDGLPRCEQDFVFLDLMYFLKLDPYGFLIDADFEESFCSRWYNLFRYTQKFLLTYNLSVYDRYMDYSKLYYALDNSLSFYCFRDARSLNDAYRFLEENGSDEFSFIITPSPQNLSRYRDSVIAPAADALCDDLVNTAVKHREINDLNIKFVQYGSI